MTLPSLRRFGVLAAAGLALALPTLPAHALDVLLCNDDGFTAANLRALQQRLQAAGHRVVVSAPVDNQSGRGGYASFLTPVPHIAASYVDPYSGSTVVPRALRSSYPSLAGANGVGTDPVDANVAYVNGSPVMACLYGIDVFAPKHFGHLPELVISGPNEGNNTGHINVSSGTVNSAYYAINRLLPAIAVSDAVTSQVEFGSLTADSRAYEVADIVVRLVNKLQRNAAGHPQQPLLPRGTGLNVNVPTFVAGAGAALPFRLTHMGRATALAPTFYEDLGLSPLGKAVGIPAGLGLSGVSLDTAGTTLPTGVVVPVDASPSSEANVLAAGGAVTVSVVMGVPEVRASDAQVVREALGAR